MVIAQTHHAQRDKRALVRRPLLLAGLGAAVAAAAGFAIAGLGGLAEVIVARPVTIASEAESLSAALEAAPWIDAGGEGPMVWLVAPPPEPRRASSIAEAAADLRGAGFAVRVIVTAERAEQNAARLFHVAEAARLRSAQALDPRVRVGPTHHLDAAQEGALEWAIASHERIAAIVSVNEATPRTPAYFWRTNGVWRAALGVDEHALDYVRLELGRTR